MTLGSLRRKDLSNQRFGKLVAIEVDSSFKLPIRWTCKCDCGKIKPIRAYQLTSGRSKTCGCSNKTSRKAIKHGKANERIYKVWTTMKARCHNMQNSSYSYYGARGITVCDHWRDSFENFLADMGEPENRYTLDRIDTNGNYCKENCRWADSTTQARNTRIKSSNKSGSKGVCYKRDKKKWHASIYVDYKQFFGGYYNSKEEAIEARKLLELKHWLA
jgi:hypothetical protein